MNEIRPDPQRCVDTSETGLTKKNGFRKNIGDFSQVSEISKATPQKKTLLKRYGEVLVPNLKHFKHSGSPYQTALINTTHTKNHFPNVCRTKKHHLRSHGFHVRGW